MRDSSSLATPSCAPRRPRWRHIPRGCLPPGALLVAAPLLLAGAAGVACAGCHEANASPPSVPARLCLPDPACRQVMVAAHRGYHDVAPENSLAAIRAAKTVGADLSELDVRHTADDVLVLMHDSEVDRTTDATGRVDAMTWAQVQQLHLLDGDPTDPEASRVPRFVDALALARALDIVLYVDAKTDRLDLLVAAIRGGGYEDIALVRKGLDSVAAMKAEDPALLVMPPVTSATELEAVRAALPDVPAVEISHVAPDAALTALAVGYGIKAQQDVLADGDGQAAMDGDYTAWGRFVAAGVTVLQTSFPDLLVPAVQEYRETGTFPSEGPGKL